VVIVVVVVVVVVFRFAVVKKRFMFELKELRTREQTQITNQCIISLLMGMKFFRVKVTTTTTTTTFVIFSEFTPR